MAKTPYDILIIGGGPGGYVAAIRAAQLGMKVAVVEREHLGGICLNWGCIPTKALLRSAEVHHEASQLTSYGLTLNGTLGIDTPALVKRSRDVSARLNGGVAFLMKKNKIDVIWGEAQLTSPGTVTVSPTETPAMQPAHPKPKGTLDPGIYEARHVILATGARPRTLPGIEPDGQKIWTYFEAMIPKAMPKALIVLGSGAIGIEFASFYQTMGVQITVVEVMPRILPAEDAEIAEHAEVRFRKQGMTILTDAKITEVDATGEGVRATVELADGTTRDVTGDALISAVGVRGNVEGLGLEAVGVLTEHGCIQTNEVGQTSVAGVYAIWDVAGPPMLAHKAEHEGVICVEAIAGEKPHALHPDRIPGCTYCHPQIASVGLTEAQAETAGHDIKVGRFPFLGNGKAIALGEPEGFIKTIFDTTTGQLLGAHMIGRDVTELIQGFVVAMQLETTEEDLMKTVFPHPTLSEMMHESVLDAYDRAVHM